VSDASGNHGTEPADGNPRKHRVPMNAAIAAQLARVEAKREAVPLHSTIAKFQ